MAEATTGEGHPWVQILIGMLHRPDIIFKMGLGDRLSTLLDEEGFLPIMVGYIKVDPRLMDLWRDLPCDMMSLMHHIIGASRLLAMMRDGHVDTYSSSSTHQMMIRVVILLLLHLLLYHLLLLIDSTNHLLITLYNFLLCLLLQILRQLTIRHLLLKIIPPLADCCRYYYHIKHWTTRYFIVVI